MKTFKSKTWSGLLAIATGLAVLAASYLFDDPVPAVQVTNAAPPPFSWNDIFKGPP